MLDVQDDWEFNVLEIYNYRRPGPFDSYFHFVRENHGRIEGDLFEAGVFRGKSLIAMGMMLKELGSDKKVYGFDSFSGFPPAYDPNDDFSNFDELFVQKRITQGHMDAVKRNLEWRKWIKGGTEIKPGNISSSGDFSGTSVDFVQKRIEFVGLDNIVLVDGIFAETMQAENFGPAKWMGGLMDCDLYQSYVDTFNFVWSDLSPGGMIYLDEYYSLKFPGARLATDEFVDAHGGELKMAPKKPGDFERWSVFKKG